MGLKLQVILDTALGVQNMTKLKVGDKFNIKHRGFTDSKDIFILISLDKKNAVLSLNGDDLFNYSWTVSGLKKAILSGEIKKI